ncbi:unnamed protein product, partial [Nesidiocoris tenuis]
MEGCRQLLLLLLCRREGVSQRGEGRAGAVCEDAEVIGRHFGAIYRSRKVGLRKKCHLSSSPARRRRPCGLASPNTSIASRPPPATAFPEFSPPAYLFTEKLIRRRYRPRRRTARPPSGTSSHLPTIFSNAMFKCDRQWEKGPKGLEHKSGTKFFWSVRRGVSSTPSGAKCKEGVVRFQNIKPKFSKFILDVHLGCDQVPCLFSRECNSKHLINIMSCCGNILWFEKCNTSEYAAGGHRPTRSDAAKHPAGHDDAVYYGGSDFG